MLFAADYQAGYAATRAYHTIQGAGTRYVVSLYGLQDGELLGQRAGLPNAGGVGSLEKPVAAGSPPL